MLGASQQQHASGKLGALSQEADRLAQEERAQTDRINKFANQEQVDATDRDSMTARLRERNQLAGERQQLSNDLSKLQKDLRDSARTLAPNQPKVAEKLRDALTEMDESDLDNRVQRTADWLRRGVNPNSNGTETEIAQGLQKLGQQLREAQKGMGQNNPDKHGSNPGDQTAALDQVQRLRRQLEAMSGSQNGQRGNRSQAGNNGCPAIKIHRIGMRRMLSPGSVVRDNKPETVSAEAGNATVRDSNREVAPAKQGTPTVRLETEAATTGE